jgi:hypothetical protein
MRKAMRENSITLPRNRKPLKPSQLSKKHLIKVNRLSISAAYQIWMQLPPKIDSYSLFPVDSYFDEVIISH